MFSNVFKRSTWFFFSIILTVNVKKNINIFLSVKIMSNIFLAIFRMIFFLFYSSYFSFKKDIPNLLFAFLDVKILEWKCRFIYGIHRADRLLKLTVVKMYAWLKICHKRTVKSVRTVKLVRKLLFQTRSMQQIVNLRFDQRALNNFHRI